MKLGTIFIAFGLKINIFHAVSRVPAPMSGDSSMAAIQLYYSARTIKEIFAINLMQK